jgi:hypothetical protein
MMVIILKKLPVRDIHFQILPKLLKIFKSLLKI